MTLTFRLLTLAAVAIGALVVYNAVRSDGGSVDSGAPGTGPGGAPASSASTVTAPGAVPGDSVRVDLAGFTGRPAGAVRSELESGGLRPQTRTVQGGPPPTPDNCAVTDVSPAGTVPRGTAVTITCVQR